MQLDRTLIAVRERGALDILDMSLQVMRRHARPIATTFLFGAVPLAIINFFLLGWMPDFEEVGKESIWRYGWWMVILIFLEAPLAGIFTTAYLGKAVFMQEPKLRDVLRDVSRSTLPLIWTVLILRGIVPAWLIAATIDRYGEFNPGIEIVLILLLVMLVTAVRAFRPYITEVVILEKNPMTSKSANGMTIGRRSSRLHGPNSGEVFARWITCAVIGTMLSISLGWTMLWFPGIFTNNWRFGPYMMHFGIPCALWVLTCYLTVVRFLNYLDLRIRQEGWEVELRVRAESTRLRERLGEQATTPKLSDRAKASITAMIVGLVIILGSTQSASAQEYVDPVESAGDALASAGDFPWYDRQTGELKRVEVEPANPNPNPSNPDWQAKANTGTGPNWNFSWLGIFLRALLWLFWIVIGLLILLVIWLMIKAFLMSESGVAVGGSTMEDDLEDSRRDAYRIEQLPFQLNKSSRADLLAEAKRLYEAGDYRGAIIYLFSYQLLLLDRHHIIRLTKGKTNRQYLRETRSYQHLAQMLERVMVPFEDVFFGDHSLEKERFENVWSRLPEFQQLLEKEAPQS